MPRVHYSLEEIEYEAACTLAANARKAARQAERDRRKAATTERRANGVSAVLRRLEPGESHVFTQYVVSAQVSATVSAVAAIEKRKFTSARVPEGVKVTRTL